MQLKVVPAFASIIFHLRFTGMLQQLPVCRQGLLGIYRFSFSVLRSNILFALLYIVLLHEFRSPPSPPFVKCNSMLQVKIFRLRFLVRWSNTQSTKSNISLQKLLLQSCSCAICLINSDIDCRNVGVLIVYPLLFTSQPLREFCLTYLDLKYLV